MHSLAHYPKGFKGTVVSPTKICLQFQDVQVKLRKGDTTKDLRKMEDCTLALPVKTTGTDIEIAAVGCQMPTLIAAQLGLIEAYIKYGTLHMQVYQDTYNNNFLDVLKLFKSKLDHAITKLEER